MLNFVQRSNRHHFKIGGIKMNNKQSNHIQVFSKGSNKIKSIELNDYSSAEIIRNPKSRFSHPTTIVPKHSRHKGEFEMALCNRCASIYYDMPDRGICRKYFAQAIKEPCNLCQVNPGYDFRIWPITNKRGANND